MIFNNSFMCGDGVGKINTESIEYHWSDVDYLFAQNIMQKYSNFKFIEPKLFFGSTYENILNNYCNSLNILQNKYMMFIMVGNQGSGKTTISKLISPNPCHFDLIKMTKAKEIVNYNIAHQIPIVIDATNYNREKRKLWLDIAKLHELKCVILWFIKDGRPYNNIRTENKINEIAYRVYSKRFQQPTYSEFDFEYDIIKIY